MDKMLDPVCFRLVRLTPLGRRVGLSRLGLMHFFKINVESLHLAPDARP